MMKISKPVLTNEFMLSPVQFTSLNSIAFKNIKNVYDGNEKIVLEYEYSPKIEVSSRDMIGIFPWGWSTLQQYVTFEWVSQSLPSGSNEQNKENGDLVRRIINFCPKYHMSSVTSNSFYQFVYVSKQIEVLGVSNYFRFDLTSSNEAPLELECLVPISSKLRSTSVSDFGVLMTNNISSTTSLDTRTLHTNSIHSLQNLDTDGINWTKPQVLLNIADMKKPIFPRKSTGTGDALDPYSSHSEPVFPMSFQMTQCKKCFHFKRGGEFLRSQQVLQSKVGPRSEEASELSSQRRTFGHECLSENKLKIVMERNKVLEERALEMKKEMERIQAESKKLKTSFYNVNKEKIAYEKFVKDFIKSLEKDPIVRVVNGNTEILVKKVNYVRMEEHPRYKKTSKRERELKAVIGLQEKTIRNLINSLQEKANSASELNQTVKLAQAFSAARDDSREFGSDIDETDEVSNSDFTSEYEFSLAKPSPPEEVTVEDTDAVLDDIRRATEMELKDIGISRSLGKCSSRDSDLNLPSLSVCSFKNQNEGTRPKKPRLFDNVEDCWPFPYNAPKTIHRKVLEPCPKIEDNETPESNEEITQKEDAANDYEEQEDMEPDLETEGQVDTNGTILEDDKVNSENYYDACEGFNSISSPRENESYCDKSIPMKNEGSDVFEENNADNENEQSNFLVTAIVPQDIDMKCLNLPEETAIVEKEESPEPKSESLNEKGKKFMCELSIDFGAKVHQGQKQLEGNQPAAVEFGDFQEPQNQICKSFETNFDEHEVKQDKSLLTFKKLNKSIEIKITQVDAKENSKKNCLRQKMVVKFANDIQDNVVDTRKTPKFEFNLALTGLGENKKLAESDVENFLQLTSNCDNIPELKYTENGDNNNADVNMSPRTVWNDASDDIVDDNAFIPDEVEEPQLSQISGEVEESNSKDSKEEPRSLQEESENGMKLCQDSFRYEKNLEFLQQKTDGKVKVDEEETAKDKPTAILIQNGQTKLALIRYQ